MTHEERLKLINAPLPTVRYILDGNTAAWGGSAGAGPHPRAYPLNVADPARGRRVMPVRQPGQFGSSYATDW
jgi:hypothetical protein